MSYCPECGGDLKYISSNKRNVCKSCGLSLTQQELVESRNKSRPSFESADEEREKQRKEYLKWWLTKKK